MDDQHANTWRSINNVADDAPNSYEVDQGASSASPPISAHSPRIAEAGINTAEVINLASSSVYDPERAPRDAPHPNDGSSVPEPPSSGVPPSVESTFASQIATNPRSVTVLFQPTNIHASAPTVPTKKSVYGGVAPYATAFASSLYHAPEPQPYCAPSVRLHLARYEQFWSLIPWDTAHPITADKVFTFLESLVLTLEHENGSYPSVVKDTIDAFDQYRRDNSHLAAYSYPQEIFFDSMGKLMSLRQDPRLQGLESLDSCFMHQEQAYKTFVNMFRLYLHGVEMGTSRIVMDSGWLYGAMRQRTVLLLARWLVPRIAFSLLYHFPWANLLVDMLPCVGENSDEMRREDLHLTALINLPREDGDSNDIRYTAYRHQLAEVCPIGALAWYFFSVFHIAKFDPPNFALYIKTPAGKILRPWHSIVFIPGDILHANLAPYTPSLNRGREIKRGTLLSPNEYSPIEAESYNGGRRSLEPPKFLLESVFPWIERERQAYSQRLETLGPAVATDIALCRFLDTLVWLRKVLLQDAMMLCMKYPDCHLLALPPFGCGEFQLWASAARDTLLQVPMPPSAPSTGNETNASKATSDPLSTQIEVKKSLPSPLNVVDAVFSALGNENVDIDALKMSLSAGDMVEKVATTTQRASNLSLMKRSWQAGRQPSNKNSKNGQREKPREIRPAGSFWDTLTGMDAIL